VLGLSAGPYRPADKRKKEILRQKRQQEKAERRQQRQQQRQERTSVGSDEDPDLVGIVPGPQPKPEVLEETPEVLEEAVADSPLPPVPK
jgi:hypothetical protein